MRLIYTALVLLFSVLSSGQTVQLKPGFGTHNGFTYTNVERTNGASTFHRVEDVLALPDGKILLGSFLNGNIQRLNADGSTDVTFGDGGKAALFAGGAHRLLRQSDGKIVVGIYSTIISRITLIRFDANGQQDFTFGVGGLATAHTGSNYSHLEDLVQQPDGKIVAVGVADQFYPPPAFSQVDVFVGRFNADGTLDPTFDGDGTKQFSIANQDFGASVDLDFSNAAYPTGRIAIVTKADAQLGIARLLPDGAMDVSFDGDGMRTYSYGNANYNDVLVLPDGRIAVSGSTYDGSTGQFLTAVWRFEAASGAPDASFSGDGFASFSYGPGKEMVLLPNNNLMVLATTNGSATPNSALIQLKVNGDLEPLFDGDGIRPFVMDPTGFFSPTNALAMDANGGYIVGGYSGTNTSREQYVVRRFLASGSDDASFDGDGRRVYFNPSTSDRGLAVAQQADGKFLVTGSVTKFLLNTINAEGRFALARYTASGLLDATFGAGGFVFPEATSAPEHSRVMVLPSGKILMGVFGSFGLTVYRYNADGTLDNTFSGDGRDAYTNIGGYQLGTIQGMLVDGNGRIYLSCHSSYIGTFMASVLRLLPNGGLDNTWGGGSDGVARYGTSNFQDGPGEMALQADGKLVVGGVYNNGEGGVIRFTATGVIDNTFDFDGRVQLGLASNPTIGDVALDPVGNIIVVGTGTAGANAGAFITKIAPTGQIDFTFGSSGYTFANLPGIGTQGQYVQIQTNGKLLLGGTASTPADIRGPLVMRFNANGTVDNTFNNNTGFFTANLRPASSETLTGFMQSGTTLYAVGDIRTDEQSDFLLLAIDVETTPLPVALIDFTAERRGGAAQLRWEVRGEVDVKEYVVERSANGRDYTRMGALAATGQAVYMYNDAEPGSGLNYYRIRIVDLDGSSELTPVRSLRFDAALTLSLSPNPATGFIRFTLPASWRSGDAVTVHNAAGQLVLTQRFAAGGVQALSIARLSAGSYWLQAGGLRSSFVKQ